VIGEGEVAGVDEPDGAAGAAQPRFDYGAFSFASKAEVLAKSKEYWNPDKTQFWVDSGIPLVIDRREEYFIYDMSGKRLIDVHLNGGTYNLGHRNPEVVQAVTLAMQHFDIGNHHFPSLARTALAEALIASAPPGMSKVVYGSGGGEAIDIALKTARHATQKRKIVSIDKITMIKPHLARVDYTWKWDANRLGKEFDASSDMVHTFNTWDRGTLIKDYGVDFYSGAPTKASVVMAETKDGVWKPYVE